MSARNAHADSGSECQALPHQISFVISAAVVYVFSELTSYRHRPLHIHRLLAAEYLTIVAKSLLTYPYTTFKNFYSFKTSAEHYLRNGQ